jgi:hypothetical protein
MARVQKEETNGKQRRQEQNPAFTRNCIGLEGIRLVRTQQEEEGKVQLCLPLTN